MWLAVVGTLVGVMGAAVGVLAILRSRQLSRPVLTFSVGMTRAYPQVADSKVYRGAASKGGPSILVYGAAVPAESYAAFACPYLLMNTSRLPVSNIVMRLEYPSEHVFEEGDIVAEHEKGWTVIGYDKQDDVQRRATVVGPVAQVDYTLARLRPGEKIGMFDFIRFGRGRARAHLEAQDAGVGGSLATRLRGVEKLLDFCVLHVFLYSENCPPVSKRILSLWFGARSIQELAPLTREAVRAVWGGKLPEAGLYWNPLFWRRLIVPTVVEAVMPELAIMGESKGRACYFEDPLESERGVLTVNMPPWDYYAPDADLWDFDRWVRTCGFTKIR